MVPREYEREGEREREREREREYQFLGEFFRVFDGGVGLI